MTLVYEVQKSQRCGMCVRDRVEFLDSTSRDHAKPVINLVRYFPNALKERDEILHPTSAGAAHPVGGRRRIGNL